MEHVQYFEFPRCAKRSIRGCIFFSLKITTNTVFNVLYQLLYNITSILINDRLI